MVLKSAAPTLQNENLLRQQTNMFNSITTAMALQIGTGVYMQTALDEASVVASPTCNLLTTGRAYQTLVTKTRPLSTNSAR